MFSWRTGYTGRKLHLLHVCFYWLNCSPVLLGLRTQAPVLLRVMLLYAATAYGTLLSRRYPLSTAKRKAVATGLLLMAAVMASLRLELPHFPSAVGGWLESRHGWAGLVRVAWLCSAGGAFVCDGMVAGTALFSSSPASYLARALGGNGAAERSGSAPGRLRVGSCRLAPLCSSGWAMGKDARRVNSPKISTRSGEYVELLTLEQCS